MKTQKEKIVDDIVLALGGAENIQTGTHCVSRFRLVLKDNKIVDLKTLEEMKVVKGVFQPNGQFHIILGAGVEEYFKILTKVPGLEKLNQVSKEEMKNEASKNLKWWQRALIHFSEIFIPIIPALVAGGLILGFRNILETNWGTQDKPYSFVGASEFINGLNSFLWIPASAIFWYLPVAICWSVFKKMGGSPVLGIIIGLTLLVELPNLYALTGAAGKKDLWIFTWISSDSNFKFGNWEYPFKIGYTAQVIPALGVAFAGVYIERFLNKYIPNVIKQIIVPLFTVLFSYTLAMFVIGPFGYIVGYGISEAVKWGLTNYIAKYFFAPIFGLIYAPLVVTGLHHALNAVMIQNFAQIGGSFIFPILAISNIAQGAAILAYLLKERKNKKAIEVGVPALISAWLGVTEPAMYGINLKKMYCFFGAMVSAAIGALLLTIFGVTSNGIGSGGIFGILSIQANSMVKGVKTWAGTGFTWFAITTIIVIFSSFGFSYLFSKIKFFNKFQFEGKIN